MSVTRSVVEVLVSTEWRVRAEPVEQERGRGRWRRSVARSTSSVGVGRGARCPDHGRWIARARSPASGRTRRVRGGRTAVAPPRLPWAPPMVARSFGAVPSPPDDTRPERVLAVYAHPDDPEVSCAGTLARWAAAGSEVHLVIATRGEKGSSDPDADPEDVAARRAEEADAAATVMGLASPRAARLPGRGDDELGRAAGSARRAHPAPAPRRRDGPGSDGGLLRFDLRQPPRPPRDGLRARSTPARRRRRARSTSPRPDRPTTSTPSTCRARSSPTRGSRSPTPSR